MHSHACFPPNIPYKGSTDVCASRYNKTRIIPIATQNCVHNLHLQPTKTVNQTPFFITENRTTFPFRGTIHAEPWLRGERGGVRPSSTASRWLRRFEVIPSRCSLLRAARADTAFPGNWPQEHWKLFMGLLWNQRAPQQLIVWDCTSTIQSA